MPKGAERFREGVDESVVMVKQQVLESSEAATDEFEQFAGKQARKRLSSKTTEEEEAPQPRAPTKENAKRDRSSGSVRSGTSATAGSAAQPSPSTQATPPWPRAEELRLEVSPTMAPPRPASWQPRRPNKKFRPRPAQAADDDDGGADDEESNAGTSSAKKRRRRSAQEVIIQSDSEKLDVLEDIWSWEGH